MPLDLSNLYISQSFERLLQISDADGKTVLDGTGSYQELKITGSFSGSYRGDGSGLTGYATNFSASWAHTALSASHEIIKEISSSHANYADNAGTASFALTAASTTPSTYLWYNGATYISSSRDVKITGSFIQSGSDEATMNATSITLTGTAASVTLGAKAEITATSDDVEIASTTGYIDLKNKTKVSQSLEIVGPTSITGSLAVSASGHRVELSSGSYAIYAHDGTDDVIKLGGYTVAIGKKAGGNAAIAQNGTYIGYYAGRSSDSNDEQNTIIGYQAAAGVTNLNYNVVIGYNAATWRLGDGNTILGSSALANGHLGAGNNTNSNTLIGESAGDRLQGDENTMIGRYVGLYTPGLERSVILGYRALNGDNINNAAMHSNNIAIGHRSGYFASGSNNIFLGPSLVNTGSAVIMQHQLKIGSGSIVPISASLLTGNVIFPYTASAAYFSGDGSKLTNLPGGGLWSGSAANPRATGEVQITGSLKVSGSLTVSTNITTNEIKNTDAGTLVSYNDGISLTTLGDGGTVSISGDTTIDGDIYLGNDSIGDSSEDQAISLDGGGDVSISNDLTANAFIGDGSGLTGLPVGGLWSGSAANPRATGNVQITGSLTTTDNIINVAEEGYIQADFLKSAGSADGQIFYSTGGDGTLAVNQTLKFDGATLALQGNQVITGSLIISGSGVNDLVVKGRKQDSTARNLTFTSGSLTIADATYNHSSNPSALLLTGSSAIHQYITSNEAANLHLTTHTDNYKTQIHFHDATGKMFILGANNNSAAANDHFLIATGSNLNNNSVFKIQRTTGYTGIGAGFAGEASTPTAVLHVSGGKQVENLFLVQDDTGREYIKTTSGSSTVKFNTEVQITGSLEVSDDITLRGGNLNLASTATQFGLVNMSALNSGLVIHSGSYSTQAIAHFSGSGGNGFLGIGTAYNKQIPKTLTVVGDISASGDLYIEGGKIYGDYDKDTYIDFGTGDEINFYAGNKRLLQLDEDSDDTVTVGNASENTNFKVATNGYGNNFVVKSTNSGGVANSVGIRVATPKAVFDVSGSILASGPAGHITASGNISSSGYFIGDGSQLTNVSATAFPFNGDAVITGSLTISGSFHAFTLDSDNIVLGVGSGIAMLSGADRNVVIGTNSGAKLTTGDDNILMGNYAGDALLTGGNNICLGTDAGRYMGSADQHNINIGAHAGWYQQGYHNICLGKQAGYGASGASTTFGTIAIGFQALYKLKGADGLYAGYNIAIGVKSGENVSSGRGNILIGSGSGDNITTGDENIIIGQGLSAPAITTTQQLMIGLASVVPISASLVTGDVLFPSTASAAYFSGDGSQLTNLPAGGGGGIWSGSAADIHTNDNAIVNISGSLIVSKSYTAGDTNSTGLKLRGSGSISGSSLFEVIGSVGSVFSVSDGLVGTLFEANNISGLPVIKASSDNTVHLGKWGGYGITISGSTPDPSNEAAKISITGSTYFTGSLADFLQVGTVTGSFSGDGSGLTGVSATPFPFNGDAVISGSLTISGSFNAFTLDSSNIVLGSGAGKDMTAAAGNNVILGTQAGGYNSSGMTNDRNIVIGYRAGYNATSMTQNIVIGYRAGHDLSDSADTYNVFIGHDAGLNASPSYCVLLGRGTGQKITTAGMVAVGDQAGYGLDSEDGVYIGRNSGYSGATKRSTTGFNAALGAYTLEDLTTNGQYNTALGYASGRNITTGAKNIIIGAESAVTLTTGIGNLIIGDNVNVSAADATGELRIGSGSVIPISASLSTGDIIFPSTASAAYFSGDGSNLTGVSATAFPFTGHAAITGSLGVSGHLSAGTKSFLIDHPTKIGYKLQHGSLEGPEHAVYVRGELKDNNIITLPNYWKGLVHDDSITVQLTAIGKPCIHYVDEIKDYEVYVGCEDGLPHCYYFIQGERKDVGKLKTELG